mmetsp:Transcript_71998/g.210914  ORF Transcript_71998/g.210914 Transcript_71998/m.210914 type:complete len:211 (-) Transcript_71998:143-775(-)
MVVSYGMQIAARCCASSRYGMPTVLISLMCSFQVATPESVAVRVCARWLSKRMASSWTKCRGYQLLASKKRCSMHSDSAPLVPKRLTKTDVLRRGKCIACVCKPIVRRTGTRTPNCHCIALAVKTLMAITVCRSLRRMRPKSSPQASRSSLRTAHITGSPAYISSGLPRDLRKRHQKSGWPHKIASARCSCGASARAKGLAMDSSASPAS